MKGIRRILKTRRRKIRQRSAADGVVQRKIDEYKAQLRQEFKKVSTMAPKRRGARRVIRKAKKQHGASLSHELPEPEPVRDDRKYKKYDFFFKSLELLKKTVSTRVFPEPLFFLYLTNETEPEKQFFARKEQTQMNKLATFCWNARGGKVVAQVLLGYPHVSHSNAILIDLDQGHLYWFEPEGEIAFKDLTTKTREEQIQYELHQTVSQKLIDGLSRFGVSLEMAPLYVSCPLIGPQYREEATSINKGNCGIWSIMFMHYCLSNPTLGIYDINNLMVYSFEPRELADRINQYKNFLIEYYETGTINPNFQTFLVQQGFELTRERCQDFLDDLRARIFPPRNPVSGKRQEIILEDIQELRGICKMRFGID